MLLSILYRDGKIVAAAPACDQQSRGNQYWIDSISVELPTDVIVTPENFSEHGFETSHVNVDDRELRYDLLKLGIDDSVDTAALASRLVEIVEPTIRRNRAA